MSLSCSADTETPPGGISQLHTDHKHTSHRLDVARSGMMVTPDYFSTNQAEKCPQADQSACNPVTKNFTLKATVEFGSFGPKLMPPRSAPNTGGAMQQRMHFPSPQLSVNRLALLQQSRQTQV